MGGENENNLTLGEQSGIIPSHKVDAVEKIGLKFRWTARHLEHGAIKFSGELQVINGLVVQGDVELTPIERFRGNHS